MNNLIGTYAVNLIVFFFVVAEDVARTLRSHNESHERHRGSCVMEIGCLVLVGTAG